MAEVQTSAQSWPNKPRTESDGSGTAGRVSLARLCRQSESTAPMVEKLPEPIRSRTAVTVGSVPSASSVLMVSAIRSAPTPGRAMSLLYHSYVITLLHYYTSPWRSIGELWGVIGGLGA